MLVSIIEEMIKDVNHDYITIIILFIITIDNFK